jgi:hypothetical protein
MRAHDAAAEVLRTVKHPLPAKEIARRILESGQVRSAAQDPVFSIASTLEKTIREGLYNNPELVFVQTPEGRHIGLPEYSTSSRESGVERATGAPAVMVITIPGELREPMHLAIAAGLAVNDQEAAIYFMKKGAASATSAIRAGLEEQIQRLSRIAKTI